MDASYLASQFAAALPYEQYLATGTPDQQRRWNEFGASVSLSAPQKEFVSSFVRGMKVLVISGIWCGDCVQQCPMFHCIAKANPKIDLRLADRDVHKDLSSQLRVNGGSRVPVVLFMAEDHELCSICGDRTLSRYRAIASRQLGAYCPTGIGGANMDEVAATLLDWLNEFERVQLMLRVSPRLRQKHGD